MNSSRGVNEEPRDQEPVGTTSKDDSATPAARRVPALLLDPLLWAIALTLFGLCVAIPVLLFLKGDS